MTSTGNLHVLSGLTDFYWTPTIKIYHFNSITRGSVYLEINLLKALRTGATVRLNISWKLQFCLSGVSDKVLTSSAVNFSLSYVWRLRERSRYIGESSEQQGAPSWWCGNYWETWDVLSVKGLSGLTYPALAMPPISPLTTVPRPRPSSYTGCSSHMPRISMFM